MTTQPQPEALAEAQELAWLFELDSAPEGLHSRIATVCRAYIALHAECEAMRANQAGLRNDADKFGNALNEAGWAFVDAYRHHMGESEPPLLFNNCKSILRESILAFLDAAARAAKEQA